MVNKWYKEEIAFLNEDSPGQRMNDFIFLTSISYKEGGLHTAFCVLWEARCTARRCRGKRKMKYSWEQQRELGHTSMKARTYNLSTWKTEAEGLWVWGLRGLQSEFQASLWWGEGVKLEKQLYTPCTGPTPALGCWACALNLIHAAQSWVTPHTRVLGYLWENGRARKYLFSVLFQSCFCLLYKGNEILILNFSNFC